MAYTATDVRTDTYPIPGRFSGTGTRIGFQGSSSSANSVAATFADIVGNLQVVAGRFVITFDIANGSGMGAVVNGTKFGATADNHYRVVAVVAPAG